MGEITGRQLERLLWASSLSIVSGLGVQQIWFPDPVRIFAIYFIIGGAIGLFIGIVTAIVEAVRERE